MVFTAMRNTILNAGVIHVYVYIAFMEYQIERNDNNGHIQSLSTLLQLGRKQIAITTTTTARALLLCVNNSRRRNNIRSSKTVVAGI